MIDGAPIVITSRKSCVQRATLDDVMRYAPPWRGAEETAQALGAGSRAGTSAAAARRRGAFTPKSRPELLCWLNAGMGITPNGSSASAWADQSGIGDANRNLTQSTPGAQPAITASDSAFGGKPSLTLDGARYMVSGTWNTSYARPITIYIVSNVTSVASDRVVMDGLANSSFETYYHSTSANLGAYAGAEITAAQNYLTVPNITCIVWNGASSAIYVNAITTPKATGNTSSTASITGLTVGATGAIFTAKFIGSVAEIVILSGADTTAQRSQMMGGYMSPEYGITVAP